jgi:hypothetical protein
MDHPLGIGGKDRARRVHRLCASAAHDRKRAVFRAGLTAGDGRIDAEQFLVASFHRDLAGNPRGNRGVIDEQRAPPQRGKRARGAEHDIGEIIIVANAGDDDVGSFRRFSRRRGDTRRKAGFAACHASARVAVRL